MGAIHNSSSSSVSHIKKVEFGYIIIISAILKVKLRYNNCVSHE